jgi:hypothetical protein
MSSSLNQEHPSDGQLRVARSQRRLLDALLSPERVDHLGPDRAVRAGVEELIDAGLAVERVGANGAPSRVRLTNCGLAAALALLDDSR